jgi:hypothetical protein
MGSIPTEDLHSNSTDLPEPFNFAAFLCQW